MRPETQDEPAVRFAPLTRVMGYLRPRLGLITAVLIGPLLLGTAILVATGLLILHLREQDLTQARHELEGQAIVLSSQAEHTIEAVEVLQTGLQEHFQTAAMRTPAEFRDRFSGAEVGDELRARAKILPQLDALVIIDADGFMVNYSRTQPLPSPALDVSDRDYFAALKDHPERTTFVSEPIRARSTGIWTIYISRRIQSADGKFLGIIMGALQLDYFERFYASIKLSSDSAITLMRTDGRFLARHPPIERLVGKNVPPQLVALLADDAAPHTLVLENGLDGRPRLMAIHRLNGYPLAVMVSNTTQSIFAGWKTEAEYLAGLALLLELMVVGGAVQTLRQVRDQRLLNEARAARVEAEAALMIVEERDNSARKLESQGTRFSAALANMSQALVMLDNQDRVVVANDRLLEMFNVKQLGPGMSSADFYRLAVEAETLSQADLDRIIPHHEMLKARRMRANYTRQLADGRALNVNFAPVEDGGWMLTLEDVTEHWKAETRIAHMAHHDMLTQLPNRVLFHSRLSDAVARGRRGELAALLYLDLDHFKSVNDTLGHPTGDALLCAVTQRLRSQVRETDTIARLGGDEFAILQSGVQTPDDAKILAARVIEAISLPFEIDGHRIIIGTSVGIAIIPQDGDDPDMILRNADMALYRAKADGRGLYSFFEAEMDAIMRSRRQWETQLHQALANGEFRLFYQPLMRLEDNTISGFEALIRWIHPERGLLTPSEFVSFAEASGLIVPIGRWVLQQACQEAARWPAPLRVSVNVSALQFASHTLVEDVEAALRDSGLEPSRLELEVTETAMLKGVTSVLSCMNQLHALGVGLTVDDLGTGCSSLIYLRRFPFTKVKIDRSLIDNLGLTATFNTVVAAIIALCHALNLAVLAEGVESERQLHVLRDAGCAEAQGYLFSPPLPPEEVLGHCHRLAPEYHTPLLLTASL